MNSGSAVRLERRGERSRVPWKPSRALAWLKWRWVTQHTQQSVRTNTQTQKPQQRTYYIFNTIQHKGDELREENESVLFMKHEMRLWYMGEWIRIVSWQESEYVCQFGSCWVCFCPRLVPAVARVCACVCVWSKWVSGATGGTCCHFPVTSHLDRSSLWADCLFRESRTPHTHTHTHTHTYTHTI